jgi:chemotaxis methyl-accepting protein methylase
VDQILEARPYFDGESQREILAGMIDRLTAHGYLIIGSHESLP